MPRSYLINRTLFPPQISTPPNANLGIVVVIPCYNEKQLERSLESLHLAENPSCSVEVIVVINDGEQTSEAVKITNQETYSKALLWTEKNNSSKKQFHIIYQSDLPRKKAGVGLARKIGMDEATLRLEAVNNSSGVILGFDADSLCEKNYFLGIENHFKKYPSIQAASLWYEHPLEGDEFGIEIYEAIIQYELHLRYFTLAKRFANYPHAFETIGSSMAVRADAYQQQGGMNTRKAGEDFYFLNKFMVLGKLNELNTTKVIPSPRISDRVPFGTGKAVGDLIIEQKTFSTYAYQSFIDFKKFNELVPYIRGNEGFDWGLLPDSINAFLETVDAQNKISEIRKNTTDYTSFEKRFYRWFDPFMVMKFAHYCRDHFYKNISVLEAGRWILENYFETNGEVKREKELLQEIRKKWKSS